MEFCPWRLRSCNEDISFGCSTSTSSPNLQSCFDSWEDIALPIVSTESFPCVDSRQALSRLGWFYRSKNELSNIYIAECILGCSEALMSPSLNFDAVNSHRWFCPLVNHDGKHLPFWVKKLGISASDSKQFQFLLSQYTLDEINELF